MNHKCIKIIWMVVNVEQRRRCRLRCRLYSKPAEVIHRGQQQDVGRREGLRREGAKDGPDDRANDCHACVADVDIGVQNLCSYAFVGDGTAASSVAAFALGAVDCRIPSRAAPVHPLQLFWLLV